MPKPHLILVPCLASDPWLGVREYNARVRSGLARHADAFDLTVCAPAGRGLRWRGARAWVRNVVYPLHVRRLVRRAGPAAVLHVTDQFHAPLLSSRCPSVATCHDLIVLKHSDLSPGQYRRWVSRVSCLKRARRIFADSHSTARDLQAELNIEPARIVVNHLGVDESFHPISQDGLRSSAAVGLGGLLASHRLILHVGSNVVQKNMPTLLRALRELLRQGVPVKLVKVGDRLLAGRMASLARELGVEGAIMDLGSLPRADLVEVYNACDVLVFPSLCEGFGLPVLEAQACGLPCVLADASSLPEVGGDAALYHPANDAAELARQVLRILNEPGMRPDLVKRGKENASRFTWDRHVERLVEEYRGVAHEWRGRTQVAQRASRR